MERIEDAWGIGCSGFLESGNEGLGRDDVLNCFVIWKKNIETCLFYIVIFVASYMDLVLFQE
jgi:hypothetical protein